MRSPSKHSHLRSLSDSSQAAAAQIEIGCHVPDAREAQLQPAVFEEAKEEHGSDPAIKTAQGAQNEKRAHQSSQLPIPSKSTIPCRLPSPARLLHMQVQ